MPHLHRHQWRLAALPFLIAGVSSAAWAQAQAPSTLVDVARLWSAVRYTHPALADGRIDWDRALVDALPAFEAARDLSASGAAVAKLMAPLADPSLRIYHAHGPEQIEWAAEKPDLEWLPQDVALVHLHSERPIDLARFAALERARAVILDIRPAKGPRWYNWERTLHALLGTLIVRPLTLPAQRFRFASGPRPTFESWEGLPGGFMTMEAEWLLPADNARARPLVFIVNDSEAVPGAVLALQRAGLAQVVAQQNAGQLRAGPQQSIWMSGMAVRFSAGELVTPEGKVDLTPTLTIPPERSTGPASGPVQTALKLLAKGAPPAMSQKGGAPAFPVRRDEPRYRDMPFPPGQWRPLACFKLWAVMDRHFPAKSMMSASWDEALLACLARMPLAKDALDYGRIIEEMAAMLDDSHVMVYSRALDDAERAGVGLRVDHIEGRFIVTGIAEPALLKAGGVRIGDEIVSVDGQAYSARVAQLMPRIAASTAAGKMRNGAMRALNGPTGSEALLVVRGPDGHSRELRMPRTTGELRMPLRSDQAMVQVLDGNVGYVDLARLEITDVDAMFDKIGNTGALIFDMRGYPHGVAHHIAPRLNVNGARRGPVTYQNLVTSAPLGRNPRVGFEDDIGVSAKPLYRGKLFMLINEHAQSQAEHLASIFATVAPVTFVGTPTAGANGELRLIVLPGNVTVSYSGHEVRHADGSQLQRLGVQPHIAAAPTVAGVRAGRDEVLELALAAARRKPEVKHP